MYALRGHRRVLLMVFFLMSTSVEARIDSLSYHIDLYATASTDALPHWITYNRWGILDDTRPSGAVVLGGVRLPVRMGDRFSLQSGVDILAGTGSTPIFFHQLYANLSYGALQLKVGKEAYTVNQYSESLGTGSFFMSNNYRPPPRIGAGFYRYAPLPLTHGFVEFKGAVNFGLLNDNRLPEGVDQPYLHEKFLYLRSAGLPVNVHLGICHSVIFGGTTSYDWDIPVDLIPTMLAMSSSKIGGGDSINRAGGHFGLYDVGLRWKLDKYQFQLYLQQPISDNPRVTFLRSDRILGLSMKTEARRLISGFLYEYIQTDEQNGEGLPDAVVNGNIVSLDNVADYDQFMLENFGIETTGITREEVGTFLENELNYGHQYGGRDDYYNNYLYPRAMSYHQFSMGNTLFHTKNRILAVHPSFDGSYDAVFVNNRIKAHHFGIEGWFSDKLQYRAKATVSDNYGTYTGLHRGRYNWASEHPGQGYDYLFENGLKQYYCLWEMTYRPSILSRMNISFSLAYDFGEIYDSFGAMVMLRYNGLSQLKK